MDIDETKHLLLKRAVLLTCLSIVLGLIVRPMLVQMDMLFTLFGLINLGLALLFYFYLTKTTRAAWHSSLMFVVSITILMPLLLVSGGVNSQFVVMIPILPLLLSLVGEVRTGLISAILLIFIVIGLAIWGGHIADITEENNSLQKTYSRAFWLCVACAWSAYFGSEFDRLGTKLTSQLQYKALFDGLTKVSNRRSILNFLEEEAERQKQIEGVWLSVLMIDVDHFKAINDRYGHMVGDRCLRTIAQIIRRSVPASRGKVGRYGGEEFIVVLTNSDSSRSKEIAEEIRQAISDTVLDMDEQQISLTATIGVCSHLSTEINDIDKLIKEADDALYLGKKLGRNRVVCAVADDNKEPIPPGETSPGK